MKENYTVLRRAGNEFKEIGKIVKNGKHCVLVGFSKEDEEFFEEIGYGEESVKPKDGDLYIQALTDVFAFSSTIAIRKDS